MTTRTAPDIPRYDASVQRSVKNIHDRDPLLIPQLFVEAELPWHRRRGQLALIVVASLVLLGFAVMVFRFGVGGAVGRLEHAGLAVARGFAHIAAQ